MVGGEMGAFGQKKRFRRVLGDLCLCPRVRSEVLSKPDSLVKEVATQ